MPLTETTRRDLLTRKKTTKMREKKERVKKFLPVSIDESIFFW